MRKRLEKNAMKQMNQSWWIPGVVFVLAEFSLSRKCLRNLGSMSNASKHVLPTARKLTTVFLVRFGECFGEHGVNGRLLVAVKSLYSCSDVCVRIGGIKSQSSSWVLDLDIGVCFHHYISWSIWIG